MLEFLRDQALRPIFLMAFIAVVTMVGDYFLKLASLRAEPVANLPFAIGAGCYALTALGFALALQGASMAAVGVWYALLTVLFMTGMGVFVFGENLRPREMLGVAMAVGSILLLARFAD
ncbi:hypothetical protein LNKW23_11240 [Paralimibaculum aggregatum]|uniref:Uncharacterized protein n=1 Tax=Paralimibaculum aggregatum TaxID=3036245 RepID=A0ABQ6LHK3_9RHOB|nr:hypothetical protein [Limibaculum sp. NKW23]GMG81911.1 hypothetical protein LNKW23_11240 [Limibaculum sp. NKW23]